MSNKLTVGRQKPPYLNLFANPLPHTAAPSGQVWGCAFFSKTLLDLKDLGGLFKKKTSACEGAQKSGFLKTPAEWGGKTHPLTPLSPPRRERGGGRSGTSPPLSGA